MLKALSAVLLSTLLVVFVVGCGDSGQVTQPAAEHPTAEEAVTEEAEHPTAEEAEPEHPTAEEAPTEHPTTEEPAAEHQTSEHPE